MNSSLHTLTHELTMYQLLSLFLCALFMTSQIKEWHQKQNSNHAFIKAYCVRFYMMLIFFVATSPVIIFSASLISIFFIVSIWKNYYASIPKEYEETWFYGKEKPLGITIGWTQTQQALYWFIADVVLFCIFGILLPWVFSSKLFIPFDTIITRRFDFVL